MPSDHAQFMFFLAAYLYCWMRKRWHVHSGYKFLAFTISLMLAVVVGISRVHMGVHTENQVYVGSGLGLLMGLAWYALADRIIRPLFPWIEDLKLSRWLLIRDSGRIRDVMRWEYMNHCATKKSQL